MSDNSAPPGPGTAPLPPDLRFLKLLVTGLTATMILGLLTIIGLLVIRLPGGAPALPGQVALPEGETARAVTFGRGWIAVVTEGDEILILDAGTGALRQRLSIGH
jgi:hypothetical protein